MAVRPPASACASSDAESDDAKARSEGMSHVRAALSRARPGSGAVCRRIAADRPPICAFKFV